MSHFRSLQRHDKLEPLGNLVCAKEISLQREFAYSAVTSHGDGETKVCSIMKLGFTVVNSPIVRDEYVMTSFSCSQHPG